MSSGSFYGLLRVYKVEKVGGQESRAWRCDGSRHGSPVHAPPAFQNNFQSSDKKKRSVTAASVKHNRVSSGPPFTWLKGVTPERLIFVQDSTFVNDQDLNDQRWPQKQLFNILDRPQVAALPHITHCSVILEARSLADMDAAIMGFGPSSNHIWIWGWGWRRGKGRV